MMHSYVVADEEQARKFFVLILVVMDDALVQVRNLPLEKMNVQES